MKRVFSIGAFCFQIVCADEVDVPAMFWKFKSTSGTPEYFYQIEIADRLPDMDGQMIATRPDIVIAGSPAGEHRFIGIKGIEGYYAYYSEQDKQTAKIWLVKDRLQGLHIDPVFTSLLALERRLIAKDSFILHCAYMRYKGEAILFSAPSETGKTTQANLWKKYRKSEVINGDRALLSFQDGRLMANGWPVCGTSEVCENESTPVRAIVMLSQGQTNEVRLLQPLEALMQLYSQTTVNTWNKDFTNRALDLIERAIRQVPVYHLSCTISLEAVECLEKVLEEGTKS